MVITFISLSHRHMCTCILYILSHMTCTTNICDSLAVAVAILAVVGSGGVTPPDLVDPGGEGSAGGQSPICAYKYHQDR